MERFRSTLPARVEQRSGGRMVITGYGAVWYNASNPGSQYLLGSIYGDIYERIRRGAFDRAIREDDCVGLFNHDPNMVLGRKGQTMRLTSDAVGLRYEIDAPDTQPGRDLVELIRRGDVKGSSFSFSVRSEEWTEEEFAGETVMVRYLNDVSLYDVSPCVFPAYTATTADAGERASAEVVESIKRWREGGTGGGDLDRVNTRIAELQLAEANDFAAQVTLDLVNSTVQRVDADLRRPIARVPSRNWTRQQILDRADQVAREMGHKPVRQFGGPVGMV